MVNWGDVPGWVEGVGTIAALSWAVFLYSRSLGDQRRAQARKLAPVGGAVAVQALPGTPVEGEGSGDTTLLGVDNQQIVVISEAFYHRADRLDKR
ncbi:MAG TPA: hypothetical protein DHV14_13980 [Micrococcales bacterium]|uniref:hypothetical protein n=1 Tax=Miniimonas arenae TaxID=676201 RepID=UPI000ECE34FF|nr:hypothetical protein [Miniimonas arenae]HCX86211.1 hypothetical protein [Micrococcales bacterium]